ncbi:unnamed protein product [Adineta ricciae]|uniref:DNA-directed primase/polymerase protein n=1 Tax=Adineta ricciae TaxID=249248 RepID=A0A816DM08_ADIRI|nr:unnamed protein product [Adineta ricciae]CAF1638278.1 unnamed protein product [Adineta ricciae]
MTSVQEWIKRLFPYKSIFYRLTDFENPMMQDNHDKSEICISIEKENKSRQYCSLTFDQLTILYEYCPVYQRCLYESIPYNAPVKTYVDFEYYVNKNLDIQNHHIGLQCCLRTMFHLLNDTDIYLNTMEINDDTFSLKQFLVLEASTSEKISYHFIHANPSVLFDNISSLKVFMKIFIHFLLFSIIKHKCQSFDVVSNKSQYTIPELIEILSQHVDVLRKQCSSCYFPIPNISISDAAHILVKNKLNEWKLAVDVNVYGKNQQFRLFNCINYGQNNPLTPCESFSFNRENEYSSSQLLYSSMISLNHNQHVPIISFKNNQFNCETSDYERRKNCDMINRLNDYLKEMLVSDLCERSVNILNRIKSDSTPARNCFSQNLFDPTVDKYTMFVHDIIKADPSHRGTILSCRRGDYNRNILFFNIGGNYRYCPKINTHHKRNTVAIMINTENNLYSIRCKDKECDNTVIIWKPIS